MMKPVLLSTGEIVHLVPVYEGPIVGDGLGVSRPGDPGYDRKLADSVRATPTEERKLRRELKTELDAGDKAK